MSDIEDLLATKSAADAAVADAEERLLAALVAAKDKYRSRPSPATKAARDAAVADVQALRAAQREGRSGVGVGGDVFLSTEQDGA